MSFLSPEHEHVYPYLSPRHAECPCHVPATPAGTQGELWTGSPWASGSLCGLREEASSHCAPPPTLCSLFPTMPRHNLYKVAPLVKSLCAKHGIQYQVKPLLTALQDIVR